MINEGDIITIDGGTGDVILGSAPLVDAEISGDLEEFLNMADKFRKTGVWANADTPTMVAKAIEFKAEGFGSRAHGANVQRKDPIALRATDDHFLDDGGEEKVAGEAERIPEERFLRYFHGGKGPTRGYPPARSSRSTNSCTRLRVPNWEN